MGLKRDLTLGQVRALLSSISIALSNVTMAQADRDEGHGESPPEALPISRARRIERRIVEPFTRKFCFMKSFAIIVVLLGTVTAARGQILPQLPRPFRQIPGVQALRDDLDARARHAANAAVAEAGAPAYEAAAATMFLRHPRHQYEHARLSNRLKAALRGDPGFRDQVLDNVEVVWGARMLNRWGIIELPGVEAAAQTFGYHIYMTHAFRQDPIDQDTFGTLIHELVHTRQFVGHRESLRAWGYEYFFGFAVAGLDYESNVMEREPEQFRTANLAAMWRRYNPPANAAADQADLHGAPAELAPALVQHVLERAAAPDQPGDGAAEPQPIAAP